MDSNVTACESIIAYEFSDKLLCAKALNTSGNPVIIERAFHILPPNKRMGVYGDVMANSALCRKWVDTNLTKGQWDNIRQQVLSNNNLAGIGRTLGLNHCVILNPGTRNVSDATMATTIEAIIGAVHIDGGDSALERVMEHLGLTHALLQVVTSISFLQMK